MMFWMFCSLALILGLFPSIGLMSDSGGQCSVWGIDKGEPPFSFDYNCINSADDTYLEFDRRQILREGLEWPSDIVNGSCKRLTVSGLQYIEPGGFQGLENITTLVIRNYYFDVIEYDMFRHLDNLQNLVIGGNCSKNIIKIENEAFHNLENLVNLTLSNNTIYCIQTEIFKGLVNVTFLDLSYNKLEKLGQYIFTPLRSLKNVDLRNNNLTRVSQKAFHNLANLRFIDLRDNLIKVIEEPLFGNDEIPVVLNLTGNPLLCDCRMAWISSWLNISDRKIYGRCHAPKELENRSLSDVYNPTHGLLACNVITHKEGTLLELSCSGVDCTWTTPDGRQLSEHGERQGPYILTNNDALVIDTNGITGPSIQNFTFVTSENVTRVLTVNITEDQVVHFPTKDAVVFVYAAVLVIIIVSLVVVLMVKKPRKTEEETSLICSDSSRSSRLTNATQEPTDDAAKLIKSFMAAVCVNMNHSEFSNLYSSPGPSSSPSFPYNKHGNRDRSESSNLYSSLSPPSSPSVSYIKYANLDSESSNSDSENMC